jgi:trk system potassium uptake protein TrkH
VFPRLSAPRLIAGAFALLILAGTLLLKLPASNDGGLTWLDAFFQSVSAVTVTGLQVVRPAEDFTVFGHAVLMLLMQLGGIGIMTAATVGALLIGQRMGFRQLLVVREELASPDAPRNVLRLIGQVALVTLMVEALGAVLLSARLLTLGYGPGEAAGYGVFHAVAGFTNSGFDIFPDGLARFAGDPTMNLTLVYLMIAGGLGFPVLINLYYYPRIRRLALQSKLVLITTGILFVVGILSVALLEWTNPRTLGGEPVGTRLLMSVFQGVTPRSGGFATVDYAGMREPTLITQTALMFIGAGPVSTGGGIKVTTVALVFLILVSQLRGQQEISVFERRIPSTLTAKALAVLSLASLLVFFATMALMVSDGLGLMTALFEVTSAFGTTGLSLGVTPELGAFGKLLLVVLMFAGRIGPITVILALSARAKPRRYSYPEEEIAIG